MPRFLRWTLVIQSIWTDSSSRAFQHNYSVAVVVEAFVNFAAVHCRLHLFCLHVLVQVFQFGCNRLNASGQANNCLAPFTGTSTKTGDTHPRYTNGRSKHRCVYFNHGVVPFCLIIVEGLASQPISSQLVCRTYSRSYRRVPTPSLFLASFQWFDDPLQSVSLQVT